MNNNITEVGTLIEGFKLSCQTEGKSPRTITWYSDFLGRFVEYLKSSGFPKDAQLITKEHIKSYVFHLQTQVVNAHNGMPLSPATIQGYVRSIKAFFAWADREEYLPSNPTAKIPVPKAPIKVIPTFTEEHVSSLITECRNDNGTSQRNLTIILLLLDTGVRVSELVGLDVGDVNLEEGFITIKQGKGGKGRVVPVGSLLQKSLWKYLNGSRPTPLTDQVQRLFLSEYGLPLTRNGIQQLLRRMAGRAGVSGVRCSPHTFRHTFAKNYLLRGGDIFSLQKILGHSSLNSVRIYLNLFGVDLKLQHSRFSPVDALALDPRFNRLCR